MKKTTKKNSAAKKLLPALGMLMISASMLATSTYAWFSLSDTVTVTGMSLQASADGGLLIINETDTDTAANWKTSAEAAYDGMVGTQGSEVAAAFLPTSTADITNWYYKGSSQYDNAEPDKATTDYAVITPVEGATTDGIYLLASASEGTPSAPAGNYYLLNKFYIKSSGSELTSGALKITQVKATGASSSTALDKSLRIAVKVGDNAVKIFAPVYESTDTAPQYHVGGYTGTAESPTYASTVTAIIPTGANGAADTATGVVTIPANTAVKTGATGTQVDAVPVLVYAYFEGEDTNCKSANANVALDTLSLDLKFAWIPS
jgi:hypothetical protein